jgi:hypothetical protein
VIFGVQQLSGVIKHIIAPGRTMIGRAGSNARPTTASGRQYDHVLRFPGVSIQEEHCVISRTDKEVSIKPASASAQVRCHLATAFIATIQLPLTRIPRGLGQIFVNGQILTALRKLEHNDRVVLSPTHIYIYHADLTAPKNGPQVDYDFVQRELANAKVFYRPLTLEILFIPSRFIAVCRDYQG